MMDPELIEYLQKMEARLRADIKHDIQSDIQQAKDETITASRDMQTELLRYIGNITEPFNVRMRHLEANAGNLDTAQRLRLAAVEERLFRIEKKVLGESPGPL